MGPRNRGAQQNQANQPSGSPPFRENKMPNSSNGKQGGNSSGGSKLDESMVRWTRAVAIFTGLLFVTSFISDLIILASLWNTEDAQKSTREQLRAFLAAPAIVETTAPDANTGKPLQGFVLQMQNVGGTRTAWAHAWADAHYFEDAIPVNFDPTKPYDKFPAMQDTVVAPNGILPLQGVGVPIDSAKAAFEGKGVIIVWGQGEYATIYDPKTALPFSYCVLMTPVKGASVAGVQKSGDAVAATSSQAKPVDKNGPPKTDTPKPTYVFSAQPYRADCNYNN